MRVKALDHFNEDEDEDNKKNKVKLGPKFLVRPSSGGNPFHL